MRIARSRTGLAVAGTIVLALVAALLLAAALDRPSAKHRPRLPLPNAAALARAMKPQAIERHMAALQRIAARDGGNRAGGTKGYADSAAYVAAKLRAVGWRVRELPTPFPNFAERSPPLLSVAGRRLAVSTLRYSGSGEARGRPVRVGSGCEASDYGSFPRGGIALVERGGCLLRKTTLAAQRAGAGGVIVYNADHPGPALPATLLGPGPRIPAVGIGRRDGRLLGERRPVVRLRVDAESGRRTDAAVIAELGAGRRVVMAGAHLDSVAAGPGINDNGSGVGALLDFAGLAGRARERPRLRLRLAFWPDEELGLYGSRRYVRRLSRAQRRAIAAYLNLDMIGSHNGGRFMYGGGEGAARTAARAVRRMFRRRGVELKRIDVGDSSDHGPFNQVGVPVLGLFSGAAEIKTRAEARAWGGRAERPFDACYHLRCDRLRRVDRRTLSELSDGVAVALYRLAWR
jgi:Zn-dependent M28 family amino/carboxypeptidase